MRLRRRDDPLLEILAGTGRRMADAVLPTAVFVVVWLVARAASWPEPILLGGLASVVVAGVVAVVRWRAGERPGAAAVGLLIAVAATLVALYTGRAEDFFLPRIIANAGSLAAWLVSIAIRWPLLGLVVSAALGKPRSWRYDPDLVRGYSRASWLWAAQYLVRIVVLLPLWFADEVVALGIAQVVLTWPLVILCALGSWPLVRSALPPEHPGPRHPVDARPVEERAADEAETPG
ncbi:DUF3159 domain-containing protein [Actinomycetospora sp. TBRC 11914]|uniref:DUF3159 domain-containing protein n=1 Tax=Actinomycetospora sp. TBRC 11914 TaxID=2729387 RepID=UPI00289A52AC|nr:DUF3159 domain-containing protein [Actinomycetospora sp. TBRC 11914]